MNQQSTESLHWQTRASVIALAGLALAGCSPQEKAGAPESIVSASSAPEAQPVEPAPVPSMPVSSSEAAACTAVRIPVFPGSRFNQANSGSIQKQLDVLTIAKTPGAEVGVRTIFNANALVANALADNLYAQALTDANTVGSGAVPTATQLLEQPRTAANDSCLTTEQLQQVDSLSRTLVSGLAPQVGRQFSAAGQVGYDTLRRNYDQFQNRYREELAS